MKISEAIKTLQKIKRKYGDIAITGGHMTDELPLSSILVTDKDGHEVWPCEPNGLYDAEGKDKDGNQVQIDGVFLS